MPTIMAPRRRPSRSRRFAAAIKIAEAVTALAGAITAVIGLVHYVF